MSRADPTRIHPAPVLPPLSPIIKQGHNFNTLPMRGKVVDQLMLMGTKPFSPRPSPRPFALRLPRTSLNGILNPQWLLTLTLQEIIKPIPRCAAKAVMPLHSQSYLNLKNKDLFLPTLLHACIEPTTHVHGYTVELFSWGDVLL